jgi:hypothetical protein
MKAPGEPLNPVASREVTRPALLSVVKSGWPERKAIPKGFTNPGMTFLATFGTLQARLVCRYAIDCIVELAATSRNPKRKNEAK